ncbi:MAG: response regulator [Terriglobales bacterium]
MGKESESRGTVLLAEDEPSILYTFTTILEEAGFEVKSAQSFTVAKESIRQNDYDAVITEFSLDRDGLGLELAREAKKHKRAPAVLLYTDNPTVERLRAALKLGVDYFAFKPMDLDELKTALSRLVALRAARLPVAAHS